jgi:hypothetical protein
MARPAINIFVMGSAFLKWHEKQEEMGGVLHRRHWKRVGLT